MTGMFLNEDYVSPEIVCKSLEITIDVIHECYYEINLYKRHEITDFDDIKETLATYLKVKSIINNFNIDYDNWFNERKGISIEVSYYIRQYFDIAETMESHIKLMKKLKLNEIANYLKSLTTSEVTTLLNEINN